MQNTEKEQYSWIKLTLLLLYIGILGTVSVLGGDDSALNFDNPNTVTLLKVLQGVSVIMVFVLPALVFAFFWTKKRFSYLGVSSKPSIGVLLIGGFGMMLAMPLINWLVAVNEQMKLPAFLSSVETWMKNSEEKAAVLTDAFTAGTTIDVLVLNLLVIAFLAAVSEEFFFRGVLQKVMQECTNNKHVAVWVTAIIFSAFHMQFYGFLPRMLMGAFLGYLFVWSGSLWPSIFAHFVNNGMAVFTVWLANNGYISEDIDKVGINPDEWIYAVVSFIAVAGSLVLVYFISNKRNAKLLNSVSPEGSSENKTL
jgi:membrane protease YdiL (CAAX protease family)